MIDDENLALLCGQVWGALMAQHSTGWTAPTEVMPVYDDEGNYTNELRITRPSGVYRLTIVADNAS